MDPNDYTWILVVTFLFACLDGFGIGANDVANAFATAVAAKSLTLKQACMIAVFTEFLGAVLLGANVADTIKNNIINTSLFTSNPALLMLAMMCALIGSSTWVVFATSRGWPVSSTHSIIGAVIGTGIASFGASSVEWGWSGVGKIIASWFISPILAGVVSGSIFLLTKHVVLSHPRSYGRALKVIPVFCFFTFLIVLFFILYDGAPALDLKNENPGMVVGIVLGSSLLIGFAAYFFLVPLIRTRIETNRSRPMYKDLLFCFYPRPHLAPLDQVETLSASLGPNSDYNVYGDPPVLPLSHSAPATETSKLVTSSSKDNMHGPKTPFTHADDHDDHDHEDHHDGSELIKQKPLADAETPSAKKSWMSSFADRVVSAATHGISQDVVSAESKGQEQMLDRAVKYEGKTEDTYSFLQVMSSVAMSFAHGSNDVANAVGPLAAVWYIWDNGQIAGSKTNVPVWLLCIGGVCINVGLVTYGYKVMKTLGNKLTYQSPSRGFCTELGTILTVLVASKLGLPVSTTHCITGSTTFVGLASSSSKDTVNWKLLFWCFFSWIITLPFAGLTAGLLFSAMAHAPKI